MPDELAGGIARQLGVGVERDDILDGRQDGRLPHDLGKAFARTAAQEGVELRELSPLAFVTHPHAFSGVPAARAVKQEKEVLSVGAIFAVQHLDPGPRPLQQHLISRQNLLRCVAEIRQQGEVKVPVPIREVMNLQGLDEAIDALQAREHRGNDHHRAAIGRDAGGIIQAREQAGFHQQRGQPVHQRHGQLTGTKEENQGEDNEFPSLHVERPGLLHKPERGE